MKRISVDEKVVKALKKKAQSVTCKTCGRGAYEWINDDGEDAIFCNNCQLEENECTCKKIKKAGYGLDQTLTHAYRVNSDDGTTNTFGGNEASSDENAVHIPEAEENIAGRDIGEYFGYLDELRDSGETNMFGARPYLMQEYDLGEDDAKNILVKWMKTFGKRHPKAKLKKKAVNYSLGLTVDDETFDELMHEAREEFKAKGIKPENIDYEKRMLEKFKEEGEPLPGRLYQKLRMAINWSKVWQDDQDEED